MDPTKFPLNKSGDSFCLPGGGGGGVAPWSTPPPPPRTPLQLPSREFEPDTPLVIWLSFFFHCMFQVEEESDVYEAVIRWVKHDLEERKGHLSTVLEHVRLPLLSPVYITDTVDKQVSVKWQRWRYTVSNRYLKCLWFNLILFHFNLVYII